MRCCGCRKSIYKCYGNGNKNSNYYFLMLLAIKRCTLKQQSQEQPPLEHWSMQQSHSVSRGRSNHGSSRHWSSSHIASPEGVATMGAAATGVAAT
jgi:hypothetical protein